MPIPNVRTKGCPTFLVLWATRLFQKQIARRPQVIKATSIIHKHTAQLTILMKLLNLVLLKDDICLYTLDIRLMKPEHGVDDANFLVSQVHHGVTVICNTQTGKNC